MANSDGTGQRRLTRSPGLNENLVCWAPLQGNGGHIAFEGDRNGDLDIFVMAPDGSAERRLTDRPRNEMAPAWSPSNGFLIYSGTGRRKIRDLLQIGERDHVQILFRYGGYFASMRWSPDGKHVAVSDRHRIIAFDPGEANGGHATGKIVIGKHPTKPHPNGWEAQPSWYSTGSSSPR